MGASLWDAQQIRPVAVGDLVGEIQKMKDEGRRLVQIGCVKTDRLEISYSFDRDYELVTLRLEIPDTETPIPSITGVYLAAFHYENELHDLFGVQVEGIAVDYKGKFYRTTVKTPFNPTCSDSGQEGH